MLDLLRANYLRTRFEIVRQERYVEFAVDMVNVRIYVALTIIKPFLHADHTSTLRSSTFQRQPPTLSHSLFNPVQSPHRPTTAYSSPAYYSRTQFHHPPPPYPLRASSQLASLLSHSASNPVDSRAQPQPIPLYSYRLHYAVKEGQVTDSACAI